MTLVNQLFKFTLKTFQFNEIVYITKFSQTKYIHWRSFSGFLKQPKWQMYVSLLKKVNQTV